MIRGATVSPAKQFALKFGRELADAGFSTRAGKAVLESVSVAKQFVLKQRLRVELGRDVVDELSDSEQRFLGRLARRPDVDVADLKRLDEDGALDDVLSLGSCRVSAGVATSGAAVLGTSTCPADLAGVSQDDLATAASRVSNAIDDGVLDTDDAAKIRRAVLDDNDVDGAVVVRTLRDGDDEAAKFLAEADDEALETFSRLSRRSGGAIDEGTLRRYAQFNGEDGARLVNDLDAIDDPDALESFFEMGDSASDDISGQLAFEVRRRLTQGHADDLISGKGVRDVADNANSLDADAQVEGVDDVLDEVESNEVNPDRWNTNHKGALYELESGDGFIREQLDEGDDLVMSFEPRRSGRVDADFDFASLAEDDEVVEEIAEEVDLPPGDVRDVLRRADRGSGPEFDAVRFDDDGTAVYYESKSGEVTPRDIQEKLVRFRAYARLDPEVNLDDTEFVLVTRESADDVTIPDFVNDADWASHEHHPWDFLRGSSGQPSFVAPSVRQPVGAGSSGVGRDGGRRRTPG